MKRERERDFFISYTDESVHLTEQSKVSSAWYSYDWLLCHSESQMHAWQHNSKYLTDLLSLLISVLPQRSLYSDHTGSQFKRQDGTCMGFFCTAVSRFIYCTQFRYGLASVGNEIS